MSTGIGTVFSETIASTRSVPRYKLAVPLNLTVLRAGIPNEISGRTIEIGEGGLGVVPASQLLVGESVRVEFLIPQVSMPVRATAVVRYRHRRSFGLQFLRLPIEQQSIVRYWTRRQGEILLSPADAPLADSILEDTVTEGKPPGESESRTEDEAPARRFDIWRMFRFAIPGMLIAAVLGWWHWEQGWAELEGQVPAQESSAAQLKIPGDLMAQHIVYRVMPEYPEPARQAGVQGVVALDTQVNAEGAVTGVRFLNGPEELSQAAIDAVRWWRYDPFLVNGQPKPVETTVAVEFRLTE
jgi:TonB family protein